jgi:glycosyltransferase involved in cell wall biosynthesis
MERLANHWADGRLAITEHMARHLKIPLQKLWGTWPSGVDLEQFAQAREARRWPVPNEPVCLVYVGSMGYGRGLRVLARAVEKANTEGMSFTFICVGSGTAKSDLERMAAESEGRIRVLSAVPHEQVWRVLAEAHVGVLPFPDLPAYRVSSPIKLFEYMAAGLPILATRITCHTDTIGEGEYVFWAEENDVAGLLSALRRVRQSLALLSQMGNQAAAAAQAWTWHESARKLKTALEAGIAAFE